MLQLADPSTMKLEGVLEDVVIFLDSWEYSTDFMIIQTKYFLGSYRFFMEDHGWKPSLTILDENLGV
jgi:hypothetical protein